MTDKDLRSLEREASEDSQDYRKHVQRARALERAGRRRESWDCYLDALEYAPENEKRELRQIAGLVGRDLYSFLTWRTRPLPALPFSEAMRALAAAPFGRTFSEKDHLPLPVEWMGLISSGIEGRLAHSFADGAFDAMILSGEHTEFLDVAVKVSTRHITFFERPRPPNWERSDPSRYAPNIQHLYRPVAYDQGPIPHERSRRFSRQGLRTKAVGGNRRGWTVQDIEKTCPDLLLYLYGRNLDDFPAALRGSYIDARIDHGIIRPLAASFEMLNGEPIFSFNNHQYTAQARAVYPAR